MAKFHDIETSIWEDLLEFEPMQKLLYIYLFSNPLCRPSGIYKLNLKTVRHYTQATDEDFASLIGRLIEYDFTTSEIWVRGKMKRILGGFRDNVKMRSSVKADLDNVESFFIKSMFVKKYEAPLKGLTSPPLPEPIDKVKDKGGTRGEKGTPPGLVEGEKVKKQERWSQPPPEFKELRDKLARKKAIT